MLSLYVINTTGVKGRRDPDFPCEFYDPTLPKLGDWQDCETDGHYLCVECKHLNPLSAYGRERRASIERHRKYLAASEHAAQARAK